MKTQRAGAFTLLELLVVIGLIAVLSTALITGLAGGGRAVALGSAQSLLANYVSAARTQALASGRATRLLINNNRNNPASYRRQIVLVEENGLTLIALHSAALPAGTYILPNKARIPAGMFAPADEWMKADGSEPLGSSSLAADVMSQAFGFEAGAPEEWEFIGFTIRGTTTPNQGSIVIGVGRTVSPTEVSAGVSPIAMVDPRNVRGLQVNLYGVPRLINDRTGF